MSYGTLKTIDEEYRRLADIEGDPAPTKMAAPGEAPPRAEQRDEPESPDSGWLKDDIKAWLDVEGVDYPAGATKAELLELVD